MFPPDCPFPTCRMDMVEIIQQAKREWEITADSLPQLIVLLDAEGCITRANRTVERWGLGQVGRVNGMRLHDVLHPACSDPDCHFDASWQRAWEDLSYCRLSRFEMGDCFLSRHLQVELRSNRCDGAHHPEDSGFVVATVSDITALKRAEENLRQLNDELELRVEARTAELQQSNQRLRTEIDERKRADEALRASREQYRILIETMNEGLAVQDAHGSITYVNGRLSETLGCTPQDMLGRTALDFIAPESLGVWQEQMAKRRDGEYAPYEIVFMNMNEERIYARVSPRPMLADDGSYAGSFAVISDISEHMRVEAELRKSESELRLLSAQLLTAQEQERKRIASELHDGIGQSLSAVKFSVEIALRMVRGDGGEQGMQILDGIVPKVRDIIEEVRRISMALRPSTLDDLGILATIGWFCREFQNVYQNLRIDKHIGVREEDVPPPIKTAIFRIMQEAMNNLAKHGGADTARIFLERMDNAIELRIEDNGQGFDVDEVVLRGRSSRGTGLASMRERAEFSGGIFLLDSVIGAGTRIKVSWACPGGKCGVETQ